ncbi:MAG: histidine--tRNA ligase [Crocinitomicaceae bacterium]|nr:histidine--tRNA ligase [Crocinitomicaceae bacterium]
MVKLNTPKGTRDFLPEQTARRSYIFDTVKSVFHHYGFSPIETPAMELKETLMGKYGEEGDRLIFKILARGDKLKKAQENSNESLFSEEALRYDLTVPFARFVVQHQNELSFPFKRYQIQPVWRADRPQKGRYREFYQCDVDMIGSNSLLNEVELIQVVSEVFEKLQLPEVNIKINNRKILEGIAEVIGEPDKLIDITVALDKLDKIGREKVEKELSDKGLSNDSIAQLGVLFNNAGLDSVADFLKSSETGQKGVEELFFLLNYAKELGIDQCEFDPTLARGLNYYTGAIFEVVHPDFPSSICGGGRYDDLTGIFGLKDVSGVGVSFGADRIYDLLLDKDLFPEQVVQSTNLLLVNFGETEAKQCVLWARQLRENGINVEVYPDSAKMKKQMKYANDKNIPFVALVGDREIESGLLTVKDMNSGEQLQLTIEDLAKKLK